MRYAHDVVARLEKAHPLWRVWYVPRATAPLLWCARPWAADHRFDPLCADSAEALDEALTSYDGER